MATEARLCACGCGLAFVPNEFNAHRQRFATRFCQKLWRAKQNREREKKYIKKDSTSRCRRSDSGTHCMAPHHEGNPYNLPLAAFYEWDSIHTGKPLFSTWCADCLKRWLVDNNYSEDHGQHPEADGLARMELYEERLKRKSFGDALLEAERMA